MPFEKSGRYGAPQVATAAPIALSMDAKFTIMTVGILSIQQGVHGMLSILKDSFNLEKLAEQREKLAARDAKLKAGETQKAPADTGTTAATDLSGMFSGLGKVASGPWGKIAILVGSLSALFLLSDKIIPKIAAVELKINLLQLLIKILRIKFFLLGAITVIMEEFLITQLFLCPPFTLEETMVNPQ